MRKVLLFVVPGTISGGLAARAAVFRDGGTVAELPWIAESAFPVTSEGVLGGALVGAVLWALMNPRKRCSPAAIAAVLTNVVIWLSFLALGTTVDPSGFAAIAAERARCQANPECHSLMWHEGPTIVAGRSHNIYQPHGAADVLLGVAAEPAIQAASFWVVPVRYYGGKATRRESLVIAMIAFVLSSAFWFVLASIGTAAIRWLRAPPTDGATARWRSIPPLGAALLAGAASGAITVSGRTGAPWTIEDLLQWRFWRIWSDALFIEIWGAETGAVVGFAVWAALQPRQRISRAAAALVIANVLVWAWFLATTEPYEPGVFHEVEEHRRLFDADPGDVELVTDVPIAVAGRPHGVFGAVNAADLALSVFAHGSILLADLLMVDPRYPGLGATEAESYRTAVLALVMSTCWWLTFGCAASAIRRWWRRRRDPPTAAAGAAGAA